jgi:uncharacterized protein (DUF2147 family)
MKSFLIILSIFLVAFITSSPADKITGTWQTAGDDWAHVHIYKSGDKYHGKIIKLKNPLDDYGKPKVDNNNPDKNKRSQPAIGLQIIKNFSYDGKKEWKNGTIYDPGNGSTYKCIMWLENGELNVRGYMGISLLGRTEKWMRVN